MHSRATSTTFFSPLLDTTFANEAPISVNKTVPFDTKDAGQNQKLVGQALPETVWLLVVPCESVHWHIPFAPQLGADDW